MSRPRSQSRPRPLSLRGILAAAVAAALLAGAAAAPAEADFGFSELSVSLTDAGLLGRQLKREARRQQRKSKWALRKASRLLRAAS